MSSNKISQLQLISMGGCYLLGTIVVSVFISATAKNEAWLVPFIGGICFIPVMVTHFSLAGKFPGKNLFQINEAVFGDKAGRIVSLVYLVFFMSLCALNLLEASNFLHYFMMRDTPLIAITASLMLACIYCVKKGFAPIVRISTVFLALALVGVAINILLSYNHVDFKFLFPVFNLKPLDYIQSTHITVAIPFGETLFLMMFNSELSEKASLKKVYIALAVFITVIMTLVHLREVAALGPLSAYATLPSYEAVRIISISSILSRTESLFALLLISLTFFKIMILFYISASGTAQIFRLDSYKHFIAMLGALLVIYAVEAYGSPSNNILWGKNVSPFIWSFFTFVLPLVTLAAAIIKGAFRRKEVASRT